MRLLLDTHAFIWFIFEDARLSAVASGHICDADNERLLSIASVWEMAIKARTGKLNLPSPLDQFLADQLAENDVTLLPIEFDHAVAVHHLPYARLADGAEHKDPFDRLIVSQAIIEAIALVSADAVFDQYGATRCW